MQRRYWAEPEDNTAGLRKIGMNDNEIAITNQLLKHTDKVFVVGGAVRDLLMGKKPHDFDLATNLRPQQIIDIFGVDSAKLTGNVFPTVRVRHGDAEIEVSTFRREISTGKEGDRNAFKVEYSDNVEDDLMRRDLTINALAINAKTGDLIDRFGGAEDIKNKTIRFVNNAMERLKEDPLRYLRAIRFKLRINGNYSEDTKLALSSEDAKNLFLDKVSSDRIREEILKGIEYVNEFSGFFKDLNEFGLLKDLFPEIHEMVEHDGGPWHREDVFTHSMDAGDNYGEVDSEDKWDVLGKLSAYLHDFGKPAAYNKCERTFHEHESIGAERIVDFLKRFRFSNDEIKFVQIMIANHMRKPTTLKGIRKLFTEIGDNYKYLVKLSRADILSNHRKTNDEIKQSVRIIDEIECMIKRVRLEQESFQSIDLNGHDLMAEFSLKPGPHLKKMLEFAKDQVLEDPKRNNKDILIESIRNRFELN